MWCYGVANKDLMFDLRSVLFIYNYFFIFYPWPFHQIYNLFNILKKKNCTFLKHFSLVSLRCYWNVLLHHMLANQKIFCTKVTRYKDSVSAFIWRMRKHSHFSSHLYLRHTSGTLENGCGPPRHRKISGVTTAIVCDTSKWIWKARYGRTITKKNVCVLIRNRRLVVPYLILPKLWKPRNGNRDCRTRQP